MDTSLATANPFKAALPGELNLWAADGYHGSTYGYYLEALVIFGSVTGRDPRSLGRDEAAAAQLGISTADAAALQRVAFETLAAETRWRDSRAAPAAVEATAKLPQDLHSRAAQDTAAAAR